MESNFSDSSTLAFGHPEVHPEERISLDENESKIFLSTLSIKNKTGAAYYNSDERVLHLLPDIPDFGDIKTIRQVLFHVRPDVVLTSSKQNDKVIQYLKDLDTHLPERDEAFVFHLNKLEILPSQMFSYDVCRRRVYGITGLPSLSDGASDEERGIYFSSFIGADHMSMVCAAGSLLKYLDQTRPGMQLEDAGMQIPILYIKLFSLEDIMVIDGPTYSSLQIFQKESHPSAYKAGGSSGKEGLSLFGMMNHTKSISGCALLRHWFLQPITNKTVLSQRLDAIKYFINPKNLEMVAALQDALKNIKNVVRILSKMKSAGVNLVDWNNMYKTIFNAICIGDICRGLNQDIYIIQKISTTFSKDLLHIADLIKKIVDFEESAFANHFVVREGIDEELDEKKRTFDGIPFLMTKIAQEELSKLNSSITKCSVTYFPQLGYLLNIPLTEHMKETRSYDIDEHLEFRFVAEDLVYYKSAATIELDQKLGDIQCDIRDHEMSIMHRLQDVILERVESLMQVKDLTAELDCVLALTTAARELNLSHPTLLERGDDVTSITGGRHPLQELCVNQFIKNDTTAGKNYGKINILTGPNASGKSVYIKQVALIVYLCHIGSYVPCDTCQVSIKDGIYTRVHTMESVSLPLSTFMIDLNQVSNAVLNASKYSCVIVDEFGKGTSPVDGLALLCAILQHWIDMGQDSPNIFLSTHFHQMKEYLQPSGNVNFQTMEVMRSGDEQELVFLYQIKKGFSENSFALHTAKAAMIPQPIIDRAQQVSERVKNHAPILKLSSKSSIEQADRFNHIVDEFLKKDIDTDDMEAFLQDIRKE